MAVAFNSDLGQHKYCRVTANLGDTRGEGLRVIGRHIVAYQYHERHLREFTVINLGACRIGRCALNCDYRLHRIETPGARHHDVPSPSGPSEEDARPDLID